MDTMTIDDLATLLRANADGDYTLTAAVELLIRSNFWLHRDAFVDACVETWGPTTEHPGHVPGACIKWETVGEALTAHAVHEGPGWVEGCSDGERRLIQIAHDLAAGPMSEVGGLGRANVALVLAAVSHASGSHAHHPHPFTEHADGTVSLAPNRHEVLPPLFPWPALAGAGDRS